MILPVAYAVWEIVGPRPWLKAFSAALNRSESIDGTMHAEQQDVLQYISMFYITASACIYSWDTKQKPESI